MTESLQAAKDRLKARYMGKAGVHGFGISRTHNAIRVYVTPGAGAETESVLAQLAAEADPFTVLVVREEPPRLA